MKPSLWTLLQHKPQLPAQPMLLSRFISEGMEIVLKIGTLPLTKQQVESTLAMQFLKIMCFYNILTKEYNQDFTGKPVAIHWQTDDLAQKNSLLVFKFLPLMTGYFSLSVPSGLSIYCFKDNDLSTAQQVWLRKLGGTKPVVSEDAGGIITAGRAIRTSESGRKGDRFMQLREEERKKKDASKAVQAEEIRTLASESGSEEDEETEEKVAGDLLPGSALRGHYISSFPRLVSMPSRHASFKHKP